jgi:hypothetical protein
MKSSAARAQVAERYYSEAEMALAREAEFRAGYGAGADAMQLERRGRPFLIEDEAVARWLTTEAP